MDRALYERASRVGQAVIHAFDPRFVIDGRWGRYTQSVYESLRPEARVTIEAALMAMGVKPSDLIAYRNVERETAVSQRATYAGDVLTALKAASAESGLSFETLRGVASIESGLNPKATNGQSRGLFQMQPAAWKDATTVLRDLPPYEAAVFDPLQNARAGAAFLKLTMRRISAALGSERPTPAQLYLAHQQGAGGFVELHQLANGITPKTNYVSARAMEGNPPPDGKGITTDKAAFYRRWIAVAERKLGAAF